MIKWEEKDNELFGKWDVFRFEIYREYGRSYLQVLVEDTIHSMHSYGNTFATINMAKKSAELFIIRMKKKVA